MQRCARPCFLLLALAGGGAYAGEVEGLYEAQVPVAGQREAERLKAIQTAFRQVLIRVTGDNRPATRDHLQTLAESPLKFVQQYLYRPLPPDHQAAAADDPRSTQLLWVRFDAQAVNQFLRQANAPVWGRMRPSILLWLAIEDRGGRSLLASDATVDMRAEIDARAQERGIPLLFPLLDLEDQRRVSFEDVWGGFEREVREASARYPADAVLVGRVYREKADRWAGRWSLYQESGVEHWQAAGLPRDDILAAGIDGAADLLAARFARATGGDATEPVDVLVLDIDSLEDYSRAMEYLKSLDTVGGVQVARVDASGVHFHVMVRGDRGSLIQAIDFGRVLSPAAGDASRQRVIAGAPPGQELTYRLLP